ncbi:MAG: hypothetical protein AAB316_19610 [Bacteroidota bacterium]
MTQFLTQLDLVRFIYKETSVAETVAICEAIVDDPLLREEYEELFCGYSQMPKAKFSPSPLALKNVLRYSEQTALNTMH